jgi:hypothetical protein
VSRPIIKASWARVPGHDEQRALLPHERDAAEELHRWAMKVRTNLKQGVWPTEMTLAMFEAAVVEYGKCERLGFTSDAPADPHVR